MLIVADLFSGSTVPPMPNSSVPDIGLILVMALSFAGLLFFFAGGLRTIMAVYDRVKGRTVTTEIEGQPVKVKLADDLVTVKDCISRHAGVSNEVRDLSRQLESLRKERQDDKAKSSQEREKLYRKMEDTAKELRVYTEDVRKELSSKMDDIPKTVFTYLKDFGAIGK